jgi:hypothetical protein
MMPEALRFALLDSGAQSAIVSSAERKMISPRFVSLTASTYPPCPAEALENHFY